jgi:hypothetical protein
MRDCKGPGGDTRPASDTKISLGDSMFPASVHSKFLAAALCVAALAGCDSIKDVRDEPFTPIPATSTVLQGKLTGLGNARPVYLDSGIDAAGHERERSYFGSVSLAEVPFSFGAVPEGIPYNVTVRIQPYGKVCTVANPSGITGQVAEASFPAVTCADDPAVPRFSIGGTVAVAVSNLPAARAILTTEDGVETLPLNPGQTTFQFARRALSPPSTQPPAYSWTVTAAYTSGGVDYNCRVAGGTGTNPTANVTTVSIQACSFEVTANVQYSAPPGGTVQPIGAGGVTLALRKLGTAEPPNVAPVTISAFSATNVVLWPALPSFTGAAFDLVVTGQPAGQACIVRMLNGTTSLGSVLWLSNPAAAANFTPTGASVRCRNQPAVQNRLTGTYQRIVENTATPTAITNREFMTFFDDGTFLFLQHGNTTGATGVEHGFYAYNAAANTLDFTVFTDTSVPAPQTFSVQMESLSHSLGFTGAASGSTGGVARATNVIKVAGGPAQLSMTFAGVPSHPSGTPAGTPPLPATTSTVTFVEPKSVPGQMAGPWVQPGDNRRLWVFNFDDTTGIHGGVNGPANLQDGCFVFDDAAAASGYYTRRGGSTGCMTTGAGYASGFATFDSPGGASNPAGYFGRFPGTQNAGDGRPPSPNLFQIIPDQPDRLIVQRTVNGVPFEDPQTFVRSMIN